jgi:hypothetical protein
MGEAQMRQKSETRATTPEQIVKDIRRATRKHHSAEEKIRIVLEGLRGESSDEGADRQSQRGRGTAMPVEELVIQSGMRGKPHGSHFQGLGSVRGRGVISSAAAPV